MKDINATIYFKEDKVPEVIKNVTDLHKKAFHVVIFANGRGHLYELDKIERIEVTV